MSEWDERIWGHAETSSATILGLIQLIISQFPPWFNQWQAILALNLKPWFIIMGHDCCVILKRSHSQSLFRLKSKNRNDVRRFLSRILATTSDLTNAESHFVEGCRAGLAGIDTHMLRYQLRSSVQGSDSAVCTPRRPRLCVWAAGRLPGRPQIMCCELAGWLELFLESKAAGDEFNETDAVMPSSLEVLQLSGGFRSSW